MSGADTMETAYSFDIHISTRLQHTRMPIDIESIFDCVQSHISQLPQA